MDSKCLGYIYKFMGRYLKPNKPFGSVKELRKAAYKF